MSAPWPHRERWSALATGELGMCPLPLTCTPRPSGWKTNYRFGRTAPATNVGNQYQSRQPAAPRPKYYAQVSLVPVCLERLEWPMILVLNRVEFRSPSSESERLVCLPLAKN